MPKRKTNPAADVRAKLGITQQELADLFGMQRNHLSELEGRASLPLAWQIVYFFISHYGVSKLKKFRD